METQPHDPGACLVCTRHDVGPAQAPTPALVADHLDEGIHVITKNGQLREYAPHHN